MKKLIYLTYFLVTSFYSCRQKKLSDLDVAFIKGQITLHQLQTAPIIRGRLETDSAILHDGLPSFSILDSVTVKKNDSLNKQMIREIKESKNNKEYSPEDDPDLTYEKFIDYCKQKNYDPVLNAKLLH